MTSRGFTLLEVLVATVVMAIAVTGLLSNLSTSMNNAARLTDYDRASLLARRQMDELLAAARLPRGVPLEGRIDPAAAGGLEAGWRAQVMPFEALPGAGPGAYLIERVQLEIWWKVGGKTKRFALEGFRRGLMTPQDAALGVMMR